MSAFSAEPRFRRPSFTDRYRYSILKAQIFQNNRYFYSEASRRRHKREDAYTIPSLYDTDSHNPVFGHYSFDYDYDYDTTSSFSDINTAPTNTHTMPSRPLTRTTPITLPGHVPSISPSAILILPSHLTRITAHLYLPHQAPTTLSLAAIPSMRLREAVIQLLGPTTVERYDGNVTVYVKSRGEWMQPGLKVRIKDVREVVRAAGGEGSEIMIEVRGGREAERRGGGVGGRRGGRLHVAEMFGIGREVPASAPAHHRNHYGRDDDTMEPRPRTERHFHVLGRRW
ncbi:hypothetical protein K458DRAFT_410198 [Lentithecium fluviatile CBS 122367]|uniref:Uncharacterized protein n=1 Tax=Lentithecium fluviatile CBS 122367 TaxID=1168545 RepID=A0A6G1IFH0_9PLEO|nr:hypothetical protein K458DRAFT_410198 [Lentithecium fluviatile CBS 122367]